MVDAGRDHFDAGRIGVVQLDQLVHLGDRVGEDGVRAGDDLGLGVDPTIGLVVTGLGLDPGQRVEGGHQREGQFVLEAVTGHSRQPVVGVDGVGPAVAHQMTGHAVGVLVDVVGQLLLG